MSKHTPGPWAVMRTPSGYDHVRGPNNQRISHEIQDCDVSQDEAQANAHLIAAAPEMLVTLVAVYKQIQYQYRSGTLTSNETSGLMGMMPLLNSTIKKAKGEQ